MAFIATSAQQSQPYFSQFCRLFVNFFYDFKKVLFEKKGSNMLLLNFFELQHVLTAQLLSRL